MPLLYLVQISEPVHGRFKSQIYRKPFNLKALQAIIIPQKPTLYCKIQAVLNGKLSSAVHNHS